MKIAPILLLLTFICIVFACTKSGNNNNKIVTVRVPDSTVIMYATLDSTLWQADSVSGLLIPMGADSGHYNLSITAKKASNFTTVNLYIGNYTGIGTYNINPPYVTATYYKSGERHFALSGLINVSNDSTADLQGNFNFIADSANGLHASNGVFRFPL